MINQSKVVKWCIYIAPFPTNIFMSLSTQPLQNLSERARLRSEDYSKSCKIFKTRQNLSEYFSDIFRKSPKIFRNSTNCFQNFPKVSQGFRNVISGD